MILHWTKITPQAITQVENQGLPVAVCTPITGSKNVAECYLLGPRSPARLSCSGQNLAAPGGHVYTQRSSAHRAGT